MNADKMSDEKYLFEPEGLNELFEGGLSFPLHDHPHDRGLIMLIKGRPGTGKTSLAMQFALSAACWKREGYESRSYYLSCEQSTEDLEEKRSRYWDAMCQEERLREHSEPFGNGV